MNTNKDDSSNVYIRPIWISGRYDADKHAALLYNLIEGLVYYFKDISADIIGEILETEWNGTVYISELCQKYVIRREKLHSFFNDLTRRGILTQVVPGEIDILNYRKKVGQNRLEKITSTDKSFEASAENEYREYVNPKVGVVQIELTYNCTEQCVHCYNPGASRNKNEISKRYRKNELILNDYYKIIDELYDLGVYKINLTGGDPFSKHDIWDIIAYIHKKGIAYDIYTNGQSLSDDDNIEKLLSYYPKSVSLSVYGGNETVHDMITRIPGSFNKTMKVIKMLSTFGVPLAIKCCIMKWNIKYYPAVSDLAFKYGCIIQYDYKLINSLDGDQCVSKFLLLDDEELEIVLQDNLIDRDKKYDDMQKNSRPCNAGYLFFCITPDGNVQPCNSFPMSLGNLKEVSFSEILNSSKLKEWRKVKLSDLDECGSHNYCKYCDICVGNNFCENGTIYKPASISCKIAKVRFSLSKKADGEIPKLSRSSLIDTLSKIEMNIKDIHRVPGNNYRS